MKVLVLGATGPTGSLVVEAARRAGHEITVLVRNPSGLAGPDGLHVLTGDARVAHDVSAALEGQQALISALGGGSSTKTTIASEAAAVFIPAAERLGVARVVVLSAFGVGDSRASADLQQRAIFSLAMKTVFADKDAADRALRASSLDWTLLYPVTLDKKPATGAVHVGDAPKMHGLPTVSRADVAEQLVLALERPDWSRRTLVVS
ncbi:NAD(P)-dependent oxidoreductase [uncultured Amnibacterium sp.]|uniref:NAD(P)-dependent oxidoreductase n=1 Tax=uncultured Amnibacterium sp. TaxID=1631851 RepID=UPI0035C95CCE